MFTDPNSTILEFPPGKIAITGFRAEVVDTNGVSVPLSEVYDHHWLVFNGPTKGNAGVCFGWRRQFSYRPLSYLFDGGDPSPVIFPAGYGVMADGSEVWGANIHLLRTVHLVDTKNCIECGWADGKCDKTQSGRFACCYDGSYCATNVNATQSIKNYFLQYTVTYVDLVEEEKELARTGGTAAATNGLDIFVLDASNCKIEYNIPVGTAGGKNPYESITTFSWTSLFVGDLMWGVGHQHIGALNISLLIDGVNVCTSVPRYGSELGKVGNEKGYVVEIPSCKFGTHGIHVKKGQKITVTSHYNTNPSDARGLANGGGAHGGVMSLFYIGVANRLTPMSPM